MIDPTTLVAPADSTYRLYVRDEATLTRMAEIGDFAELDVVFRFNDPSTWVLSLNRDHPAALLLDLGAGIIVTLGGKAIFSGPVRGVKDSIGTDGTIREASGIDDTGLLLDRVALPVPSGPPYTAAEHDVFSGTAEDAMRYFVDRNAGPSATVPRQIPGLTIGTYQSIGNPVSFRATRTTEWTGRTSVQAVRPAGAVSGDVVLAFLRIKDLGVSVTGPSGWTRLHTTGYSDDRTAEVWIKRLGAGEPSTYRWNFDESCDGDAGLSAWPGVHSTSPTDGTAMTVLGSTGAPTAPSVTTTTVNTQLVVFYAAANSDDGDLEELDAPTGFSERYNADGLMLQADALQASFGATGAKTAICVGASDAWATFTVALRADNPTDASVISEQARFDPLLERVQSIAIKGGGLRFQILQDGATRAFTVTRPRDVADTIIFSRELGTLIATEHEREGPTANYIYAGGGGEGTAREFAERGDSTTLLNYWRAETFIDKRSETGAELGQAIDEAIEKGSPHVGYELTPVDSNTMRFGRDYDIGDIVSNVIDGTAYLATVREVSLHIDSDGAMVRPKLNPSAAVGQSRGFSIGRLNTRLSRIEREAEGFTIGMGMLWTRDPSFIPSSWAWMDGGSGTIDSRGRFPIGADPANGGGRGTYALAATGGATTTTIAAHTHDLADHEHDMDDHAHGMQTHTHPLDHNHAPFTSGAETQPPDVITGGGGGLAAQDAHTHPIDVPNFTGNTSGPSNNTTEGSGSWSTAGPDINTSDLGGASTPSILPPYFAAYWIQRIST